MTILDHGDAILPDHFGADDYEIHVVAGGLTIELRSDDGGNVRFEAADVVSFRCSYEQLYDGYIEGSLGRVLILDEPRWKLRSQDEHTPLDDFAAQTKFFHLNIPDVGIIFECWAASITRLSV